nr:fimbrial protein [Citrobacter sp. ku-bf4]
MDNSALGAMKRPGDTGNPTQIVFRLLGCESTGGLQRSGRIGPLTWDETQPVVTVSFMGATDPDDPTLLLIAGMSGVGLRIQDSNGRTVIPGTRGKPQFVTTGSDELTYTVIPVRTIAPLIAGEFRASVDFGISYD